MSTALPTTVHVKLELARPEEHAPAGGRSWQLERPAGVGGADETCARSQRSLLTHSVRGALLVAVVESGRRSGFAAAAVAAALPLQQVNGGRLADC